MTRLGSPSLKWLVELRMPIQILVDVAAWGTGAAALMVVGPGDANTTFARAALLLALAAPLQVLLGFRFNLYRGRYRFGSFEEVAGVLVAVGATTGTLVLAAAATRDFVTAEECLAAGVAAFLVAVGARYSWRLLLDRRQRPMAAVPILVFGAGDAADQLLGSILRDPESRYIPVGLLDDDPRKQNLRLRGVRVLGTRESLGAAADATGATTLLLAIPSAGAQVVREVAALADRAGLALKVLPSVDDLIDGTVGLRDIRDMNLSDLLGRHQVALDTASIAGYLTGKRVLVTGAGGSIGSELCRQLVQYAPAELIMLDRDESALHAVQLSLTGRALLDSNDLVLADIRDIAHLQEIFEQRHPDVVFHAAALKHLTLLERHPGEAIKTNVWGTLSVLEAAAAAGVERFVNISTDKAADPESVLGYSKRIAERVTAHVASETRRSYVSVRFGNVLGSRGSVLTSFHAQIEAGGPITVTHPDVTRYFMTVQEAVQLVIQAGAVGRPGEALVLDMGEPVRISDLARRLADAAPTPIQITYTGLRPGEKLHEHLLGSAELDDRPHHPLISQVSVPPLSPIDVLALDPWAECDDVIDQLRTTALGGTRPSLRRLPVERSA